MRITDNAYKLLHILVGKNAVGSGRRVSRQEVFLASGLDDESFKAAYEYLRSNLEVAAPISEEEMWLTSSGVTSYENRLELRRKFPKRNILRVLGIVAATLATIAAIGAIYYPIANDRDWPPFTNTPQNPTPPEEITVVVALANNTEQEVSVQSLFRYQFVEIVGPSFGMRPWVIVRPRLLESQQPVTDEILIEPNGKVGLLIDVKMNAQIADWLHTGGKTLFVDTTLENGERIEGSIAFQRDIIKNFPLGIFVGGR